MSSPAPAPHLVLSMPKGELARLCLAYGPVLKLDDTDDGLGRPIVGAQLLWAMSGRESSFGKNLLPRHEPAYDVGGFYWQRDTRLQRFIGIFGRDGACSYGPLQILAINAKGYTPLEMGADPERALQAAVARLNVEVLGHQGARTLAAICDCWNSGNAKDDHIPTEYMAEVRDHYFAEVIG